MLIGKNITSPGEILLPVEIEKVHRALLNPGSETAVLVNRLQAIRAIDANQYRKLKTKLPYLVCADFHPKIRKKENFISTERFIVDIDHISEFELDINELRYKFKEDSRIELIYTSPSGDGLKLFFALNEKISDSGYYAMFYKDFCIKLSQQYQLGAAVDIKTNDVSRCCFVSHDPEAFYRPESEKINPEQYLPKDEAMAFEMFNANLKEIEKSFEKEKKELDIKKETQNTLSDDILNKIKEKVGVRVKRPVEKTYIQPEELDEIIPQIINQLQAVDIRLLKMTPISYGRQLKVGNGPLWSEINIFYGKKGVRVVGTTKTGSNTKLCEQIVLLLQDYFENGEPD